MNSPACGSEFSIYLGQLLQLLTYNNTRVPAVAAKESPE